MKKIGFTSIILLSILLQACNDDAKNDDIAIAPKDMAKLEVPMDHDDAQFAIQAVDKGMAEIEMGQLAIKNGSDKRIKNFGAMMIRDRTKADSKLEMIAKTKKISLPATIDTTEQRIISGLTKNTGKAFDKVYLNDIIRDHENNIKLYQAASKQLMDPDLRGYAAKNLMIFQRHLDAMNIIKGSMR